MYYKLYSWDKNTKYKLEGIIVKLIESADNKAVVVNSTGKIVEVDQSYLVPHDPTKEELRAFNNPI